MVGIDNSVQAENLKTPLTSINHPKEQLGRLTAERLIKMLDDSSLKEDIIFPATLVKRQSVAKIDPEQKE